MGREVKEWWQHWQQVELSEDGLKKVQEIVYDARKKENMSSKIHVLATVFNEGDFFAYSIRSYLPFVKSVTIVEGAYRESISVGASPRSTDATLDIMCSYRRDNHKVKLIQANEISDAQQRNVGLEHIKKIASDGDWLLLVDGDEIYERNTFRMIEALIPKMDLNKSNVAYFKSLTFVNDLSHYCEQEFPRFFRITKDCHFVNDNFMAYGPELNWHPPTVIKCPIIRFFHYSFCKGKDRFELKKKWWETRFKQPFDYSWHIDGQGQITDSQHTIRTYIGKHPDVMKGHPLLTHD